MGGGGGIEKILEQINDQVHQMSLQLKLILTLIQSRLNCILVRQLSLLLGLLTEQNNFSHGTRS